MKAFGPVPSRRLGRSLGINNIPPKTCTYACVYCQLGRTIKMTDRRRAFYAPEKLQQDVKQKVEAVHNVGERIDYLTFVPDGETTLDSNLGREIELLKPLGIRVAVITNSSLIWQNEVLASLLLADLVSLKVDSVREDVWRRVDRPHRRLPFGLILEGTLQFARIFRGQLITETMLVSGVNDDEEQLQELAEFLAELKPTQAYISIPTRPPAEKWVRPPDEQAVNRAYHIISRRVGSVEYLIGYEGDEFTVTGNSEEDILNITAVHPMREDAIDRLLEKAGASREMISRLMAQGVLSEVTYEGSRFYLRKFNRGKK